MPETISVLLVDEDTDVLELTETFLERADENLDITTKTSAPAALEHIKNDPVDAVVSDYSMPEMGGVELFESVRERQPGLPFFFFTGRDRQEIDATDITGYVQKGTGTERYGELAAEIRDAVEA